MYVKMNQQDELETKRFHHQYGLIPQRISHMPRLIQNAYPHTGPNGVSFIKGIFILTVYADANWLIENTTRYETLTYLIYLQGDYIVDIH